MGYLPPPSVYYGAAMGPLIASAKEQPANDIPYRTERSFLAGAGAGTITKSSVAPMERLKVIFQTSGMRNCQKYNNGIVNSFMTIIREEGVRGLYKGNGANCARVVPVYAIKFSLNDKFKAMITEHRARELSPGAIVQLGFWERIAAGSMAGLFQIVTTYPLDLIRTRLQLAENAGVKYKGIVDCAASTFKTEGVRGLYKGMMPSMLAGVPYVGLQMTFYDQLKNNLGHLFPQRPDGTHSVLTMLVCGSVAGLTAQTLTFPTDTVRHRMQANGVGGAANIYSSTRDCFQKIYVKEGIKGFFKGWGLNVVRSLPGAAVQFTSYDLLKQLLGLPS